MFRKYKAFFNPEYFQGWGIKRSYFEGWYYKVISADETTAFSIIPGIAIDAKEKGHAFIQVLDGKKSTSEYHRFRLEQFQPCARKLKIAIGRNLFTDKSLTIDLPGLKGNLQFDGIVPWPKPFYSPGIMGPYRFAPFLECYHGIVSMDHSITGKLIIGSKEQSFDSGRGYIEKDWGRSFPSAYVWLQSNHFSEPGISLKASVAKIPWIRNSFTGFIAGFWFEGKLLRFTTYNRTTLTKLTINQEKVEMILENTKYKLKIVAHPNKATGLAAPIRGAMEGRIEESMTSSIEVRLTDVKTKDILFEDIGRNAGLEIAGDYKEICVV